MPTDAKGNPKQATHDAIGQICGLAEMGKVSETKGDSLAGFKGDLSAEELAAFFQQPTGSVFHPVLGTASSRIICHTTRYFENPASGLPAFIATIVRETHVSELRP